MPNHLRHSWTLLPALLLGFLLFGFLTGETVARASEPLLAGTRVIDLDGTLHEIGGDDPVRPIALVFLGPTCPISNRYVPRLNEIARRAGEQHVQFLGIISDAGTSRADALRHRKEYAIEFPVVLDTTGTIALQLKPTHVPEAFVLDAKGEVVYRGRIDDRFADIGKPRARVTHHDLVNAIEAVVSGKTPPARTPPVGCFFEAWKDGALPGTVTYTRDVAPILNANCVSCHREGQVGPFTLGTYEDARARARMIARVCRDRVMPPWRAEPGFGHFSNARRLHDREIAILTEWATSGAPEGDPADRPTPPSFPDTRWELGPPDLVLSLPEPFDVPAAGDDIYRYFVIPTGLLEDRMMIAYEFLPGDPSVVHHALCYLDSSGTARKLDAKHDGPGYPAYFDRGGLGFRPSGLVGGWAPGMPAYRYPEGWGDTIPARSDLVLEVHYHLSGKPTTDRSELGLYFAKQPVKKISGLQIGTYDIKIPAGEKRYRRHAWMVLPEAATLIDVSPHMHNLGREFRATATTPTGETIPLLWIRDWDFRWQDYYVYSEPIRLAKGTRIDVHMTYDNSEGNPANPHSPPRKVKWGWRTDDEMGEAVFTVLPDDPRHGDYLWFSSLSSFGRSADPDQ